MSEFEEKKIMISGASKGIGFALAQRLNQEGAQLLLHASSDEGIVKLRSHFTGSTHHIWRADFTSPESLEQSLSPILQIFGSIDGFVNCVGLRNRRPLNLTNIRSIKETINANFISYLELIRLITKKNRYNPGLSIMSISSISAIAGSPGVSIYAASKGAVESATRCLALELSKKGIRINTIVSGQVNTEAYAEMLNKKEDMEDAVLQRQYMGLLQPQNIVDICLFLLSQKSSFISGTAFPADGGYLR